MPLVYPVLFTLFVWWFSTGAILYLDGLPRRTFRWSFAAATVVLVAALYGIAATRGQATLLGAYVAFGCSILVWGWQEIGFLMGFVTGPRRAPCPPGATGWSRFVYATQTVIHHELAIAGLGIAIIAITVDARNQTATGTFIILWVMRLSSKLNLFLGVRNLYEDFLPEHLRYLKSYFRRKAMNPLFPLSIIASTIAAVLLWQRALAPDSAAFDATQATFLATILTLAVLEHWFLVMPLPATALWRWGLRSRENHSRPGKRPPIKAALR